MENTLPETNSSPLKMDGWNPTFLLGRPIFRGYVSFREGTWLQFREIHFYRKCNRSESFDGPILFISAGRSEMSDVYTVDLRTTFPKQTACLWKIVVGKLLSFLEGHFLGAMLVVQRVRAPNNSNNFIWNTLPNLHHIASGKKVPTAFNHDTPPKASRLLLGHSCHQPGPGRS